MSLMARRAATADGRCVRVVAVGTAVVLTDSRAGDGALAGAFVVAFAGAGVGVAAIEDALALVARAGDTMAQYADNGKSRTRYGGAPGTKAEARATTTTGPYAEMDRGSTAAGARSCGLAPAMAALPASTSTQSCENAPKIVALSPPSS